MGAVSGDDDRRQPAGSDGLGNAPVPAPWGDVVIPDDLSELATEADQVRRELRLARRRRRWGRLVGLTDATGPGITAPLLIIVLAMGLALASLFGGMWQYSSSGKSHASPRGVGHPVPELTLVDASGDPVALEDVHPAVILALGHCTCTNLVAETAALTNRERLTLLVVGQPKAPALAPIVKGKDPHLVRSLADPDGRLARSVAPSRAPKQGTALVVLVATDGTMTQVLTDVQSAEEFAASARRLP